MKDEKVKAKMKAYADEKPRATPSKIAVGDSVLARQRKQNKLSTPFDPRPFHVMRKRGTMITACQSGKYITRNASQFKIVSSMFPEIDVKEQDDVDAQEDDDISESREQRTSDASQSLVSNQSSSNVGPTNSLRCSQCSRRAVIRLGQGAT